MHSTNYRNTFISVAPDCPAQSGIVPWRTGTVAALQHAILADAPYGLTSDDLLFEVQVRRLSILPADRDPARAAFFARPQACLRASPLVKSYGWGLHHDSSGRVALVDRASADYARLAGDPNLEQRAGLRSHRG